jgi:bifunctional non-homologous end joining protein LigD
MRHGFLLLRSMPLKEYEAKRHFNKTPEPTGGKPDPGQLQFVIQKHAASHLHYDFRLELRGVLKSWAVPKGPSVDPAVKRLAMLVEDHPFDYKDFEGIIPAGNYGAGTVIVWDHGTYEPFEKAAGKKDQEHILTRDFYKGTMKIVLHGKKLKGVFAIVKTRERGSNSWLLSKVKDKYARKTDITLKDSSAVSGKTIEQIAKQKDARRWQSNRKSVKIKKGRKEKMPATVSPMLATLTKDVTDEPKYIHEIKFDGYRIIATKNKTSTRLYSRSGLDYTSKYKPVVDALQQLPHSMVLDGEVCALDAEGKPNFDLVQKTPAGTPIVYYAFDLLWMDGYNMMDLPLLERKQLLHDVLDDNDVLRYSEHFEDGQALYKQMLEMGMEGVVSKNSESVYQPGERNNDWLKTPARKRQEFVIGGWAESDRGRSFRSLLFGAYNNGKFEWIGRSGGGYKEKDMPGILKQLKKLEISSSPFVNKVLDTKGAAIHYVKPKLVANFEFATWTKTGRIRKPATFLGFRNDKAAADVVREIAHSSGEIAETDERATEQVVKKSVKRRAAKHKYLNAGSNWQKVDEEQAGAEWTNFTMEHCTVPVHNLDRELWTGVTKGQLLLYYSEMASYILPYLKDRPLTMVLKLTHAGGQKIFIRDMENRRPACAAVFTDKRRVEKKGKRARIDYLVCNNVETLVFMVDTGCVDINAWASRTVHIEEPDYIWLDLDSTIPSGLKQEAKLAAEKKGFKKAVTVAKATKKILDKHKLKGFLKTSGQTGLHVYIPCSHLGFEQTRAIAYKLADEVHALVPRISTRNESIDQRGENVYIDAGQNDYADTLAAPYCIRPHHKPTVSTPLDWKELTAKLDPYAFTIETIVRRVKQKGDLFSALRDERVLEKNTIALGRLPEE